jgi:TatD-related deoxyribonuclease
MSLKKDLLFADAHLHSNPINGLGSENIARRFKERGGWFIALVGLPPTSLGLRPDLEGFTKSIEMLLKECEKLRNLKIRYSCLGGFHPAMIDKMIDVYKMSPEKVFEISMKTIEYAVKLVREGLLNGLAEIGRPHYKTSPEHIVLADTIFDNVLEIAKENDLLLHLHLEEGGWATVYNVYLKIKRYSLDPWRVILHHNRIKNLKPAIYYNLISTVPAIPQIIENIKDLEKNYVFESDYLDDPSRPGRPMYPWEIIDNSLNALRNNILSYEDLYKIHVDNIIKIYNVEPP